MHPESLRTAASVTILVLLGCARAHPSERDLPVDAGAMDAGPDGGPTVDGGPPVDAPSCDCRTGTYDVTGMGDGFSVSYELEVDGCGFDFACTVDGTERRCSDRSGDFRVWLDSGGFVQLIFSSYRCDAPWEGSYATHGGSARIRAERR